MGVQADEAPAGDEDPRKASDEDIASVTDSVPLISHKYVARLLCGCDVSGSTRAIDIRVGSHGAFCPTHKAFSLFEDFISTRPLRV